MEDLDQVVEQALKAMQKISPKAWEDKPFPHKWSKKEILGHLVDSARNNLQRFVEVQYMATPYQVIPYDQDQQVIANAYQQQSLDLIMSMWKSLNRHIGYVMRCQTRRSLELSVELPDNTKTNLQWLMEDYIEHLKHHLKQILGFSLLFFFFCSVSVWAQDYQMPLWPGEVPNQLTGLPQEKSENNEILRISQITNPDIQVYLPSARHATGQAVLICPGGGYGVLAYNWEGTDVARWLTTKGIAGIVLKYRLPSPEFQPTPRLAPLQDARQAIRLIRQNAEDWKIDPNQVGVMGFSAGGHLASTLGTHFDDPESDVEGQLTEISARPDFMVLMYPVISMKEDIANMGSRRNLIGENPSTELIQAYSNELRVTPQTPPTFLVHSANDQAVPVSNSLRFYQALLDHNVPAEMHLYPFGGHGYSLAIDDGYLKNWPNVLADWLSSLQ